MSDQKFVPGLYVKAPHDDAPKWIRMCLSLKRVELMEFLASRGDEWINVDIKLSQNGKLYAAINDYHAGQAQDGKPPATVYRPPEKYSGARSGGTSAQQSLQPDRLNRPDALDDFEDQEIPS